MPRPIVYSIIESPAHPDFSLSFKTRDLDELRFTSMRKAIAALKKQPPSFVVAEFFYGYGNNYAGVNVSNLDVFLHSLRKYAPDARVIVLVSKEELEYLPKLRALFPINAVLQHPVTQSDLQDALAMDC